MRGPHIASLSTDGWRSRLVALLLFAAFLSATLLTWEAVEAQRRHREAAARIIRGSAGIVAEDLVRRIIFEIEGLTVSQVNAEIRDIWIETGRVPTREELVASRRPMIAEGAGLIDTIFVADFERGTIEPPLDPATERWILGRLEGKVLQRRARKAPSGSTIRLSRHGPDTLFTVDPRDIESRRLIGFTVSQRALAGPARKAFERRSLFPEVFGGQRISNDAVFIRIEIDGVEILRTNGRFNPEAGIRFTVSPLFGDVLWTARVESSLEQEAAMALNPGGLPPSRVAGTVVALLLNAIALAGALLLLRRERQLELLRNDFISSVSHELRTPLTQIRMFTETLRLERTRSEGERNRSLRIIDQEARRLAHLVDDLLLFARGRRGHIELAPASHDISQIARETLEGFAPLLGSSGSSLVLDAPEEMIADVDRDAIRQILLNLLDNAAKYGPPGQEIRVSIALAGGRIRIAVEDEGPGIPIRERRRIWEQFYRLERDRGTFRAGSGIGLAVVAQLVTRLGGSFGVEDAPRGGARFVIEVASTAESA